MEKKNLTLLISAILFVTMCSFSLLYFTGYDTKFVEVSTVKHLNQEYKVIHMKRAESSDRIKVKYFAAKDYNGASVAERYKKWSWGKNIICYSSAAYMSGTNQPVGLTIDNGEVVNEEMKDSDALVIVYATGGVVVSNLDDKNLRVQGGGLDGKDLDIRGDALHKSKFIKWARDNEATVFQTHLLAFKDKLLIKYPTDSKPNTKTERERRFLAVGKDSNGKVLHTIVHSPAYTTLYEGSKRTLQFLNEFEEISVIFMINLDPGAQDVFKFFDANGSPNDLIKGQVDISQAANLLVYYYE